MIGTTLAFALACGYLFATLYSGNLSGADTLLFGSFLGITPAQIVLLAVGGGLALAMLGDRSAVRCCSRRSIPRSPPGAASPSAHCRSPFSCCSDSRRPRPARSPARCSSSRCSCSRPPPHRSSRPAPRSASSSRWRSDWRSRGSASPSPTSRRTHRLLGDDGRVRGLSRRAPRGAGCSRVRSRAWRWADMLDLLEPPVRAVRVRRPGPPSRSARAWSATSSCCAARSSPATRSRTSPSRVRSPPSRSASTSGSACSWRPWRSPSSSGSSDRGAEPTTSSSAACSRGSSASASCSCRSSRPVTPPATARRARRCCSARSSGSTRRRRWWQWSSASGWCVALLVIARPLLFASIDASVAAARGVPVTGARSRLPGAGRRDGGRGHPGRRRAPAARTARRAGGCRAAAHHPAAAGDVAVGRDRRRLDVDRPGRELRGAIDPAQLRHRRRCAPAAYRGRGRRHFCQITTTPLANVSVVEV